MTRPDAPDDHPAPQSPEAQPPAPVVLRFSKRRVMLVLALCVVVLHLLNVPAVLFRHVSSLPGTDYYVTLFSVSSEGKIPTFYSGLTLLFAAGLFGVQWTHERHQHSRLRWYWAALAVIFVLLAMDELLSVHEMATNVLRSRLGIEEGWLYHAWVIPAGVVLVVVAVVFVPFLRHLPARTRGLLLVAGAIYLSGAVVLEMAGGAHASANGYDLAYGALATIEEVLEMTGILVLLYVLLDHVERYAARTLLHVTA